MSPGGTVSDVVIPGGHVSVFARGPTADAEAQTTPVSPTLVYPPSPGSSGSTGSEAASPTTSAGSSEESEGSIIVISDDSEPLPEVGEIRILPKDLKPYLLRSKGDSRQG